MSPQQPAVPFRLLPDIDNYAVLGNPVAHSKSPLIHQEFARQTGQQLHYQAILVPVGGFARALDAFQEQGGKGVNVTLPFKGDAFASVHDLTPRARRAGAVNTISMDAGGSRIGDNTDGAGLVRDLRQNGIVITGRRLLVLGAGGAVDGIMGPLQDEQPARVVVANRTPGRAEDLCSRHGQRGLSLQATGFAGLDGLQFDVVINGTSAGLQGQVPPLPDGILADRACCYDLVYGAAALPFMRWAAGQGAHTVLDGVGMLVEQAAEAFFIWRGVRPRTTELVARLRREG